MSCPDCGGKCENSWHGRNIEEERDEDGWVIVALPIADARMLFKHVGAEPFCRGSWSQRVRIELGSALSRPLR